MECRICCPGHNFGIVVTPKEDDEAALGLPLHESKIPKHGACCLGVTTDMHPLATCTMSALPRQRIKIMTSQLEILVVQDSLVAGNTRPKDIDV